MASFRTFSWFIANCSIKKLLSRGGLSAAQILYFTIYSQPRTFGVLQYLKACSGNFGWIYLNCLCLISDLPKDGPNIETLRKQYQVGETADLMCIAQMSNPPTNLSWYINGEPVSNFSFDLNLGPLMVSKAISDFSLSKLAFFYSSWNGVLQHVAKLLSRARG